jgi:hypothetical protein
VALMGLLCKISIGDGISITSLWLFSLPSISRAWRKRSKKSNASTGKTAVKSQAEDDLIAVLLPVA